MTSILLAAPAQEPVTLGDAKAFLRVEHDADDDVIAALIAAARVHVEAQTRRALIVQTWRIVRDAWPPDGRIAALPVPLRQVVAARVYKQDGTTQAVGLESVTLDRASAPAVIAFSGGMLAPGRPVAGIELDIECGYGPAPGDVPPPLRQAIRMLVAHWYENRGITGDARALLPQGVTALIAPFRVLSL
jgi:uncharacterized phiE125 gp8 family phage protein